MNCLVELVQQKLVNLRISPDYLVEFVRTSQQRVVDILISRDFMPRWVDA